MLCVYPMWGTKKNETKMFPVINQWNENEANWFWWKENNQKETEQEKASLPLSIIFCTPFFYVVAVVINIKIKHLIISILFKKKEKKKN